MHEIHATVSLGKIMPVFMSHAGHDCLCMMWQLVDTCVTPSFGCDCRNTEVLVDVPAYVFFDSSARAATTIVVEYGA